MKNENIDIEQLKKTWQEMGKALGLNPIIEHPETLGKMNTALDKLRNRYLRMGIAALCAGVIMFPILISADFIADEYRMPVAFSYVLFLAVMGCIDFWLRSGVERINPLTMSVSEVSRLSLYYKNCHKRVVMVALPVVLCWIGLFIFATTQYNESVIWGVVCGAIIGGAVGTVMLLRFMNDYKELSD